MSTLEKLEAVKKYLQEKKVAITGKIGNAHIFFYTSDELTDKEKKKIGDQKNILAIIKGHNAHKNNTLLTVTNVNDLNDKEKLNPILEHEGIIGIIKGISNRSDVFLAVIDSNYITQKEKTKLGENTNGLVAIIKGRAEGASILLAVANAESVPEKVTGLFGATIHKKTEGAEFCIRGKFLFVDFSLDIISKDYLLDEKNVLDAIKSEANTWNNVWNESNTWNNVWNDQDWDPVYYADAGMAEWYPGYAGPYTNDDN